jgi:hypothetical protein
MPNICWYIVIILIPAPRLFGLGWRSAVSFCSSDLFDSGDVLHGILSSLSSLGAHAGLGDYSMIAEHYTMMMGASSTVPVTAT